MRSLGRFVRWETLLAIVLIVLVWLGAVGSRFFLTGGNLANATSAVMEVSMPVPKLMTCPCTTACHSRLASRL